jgi:hypothetical protein
MHGARRLSLACLGVLAGVCAAGCTSLSIDTGDGFAGQRTYVGVVTVRAPVNPDNALALPKVRQLDLATWGLRVDRGLTLGYSSDRLLSVPFDCRLVVFIRNSAELAHAETLLRSISKEEPCFARQP